MSYHKTLRHLHFLLIHIFYRQFPSSWSKLLTKFSNECMNNAERSWVSSRCNHNYFGSSYQVMEANPFGLITIGTE